jgi:hypothetical protein
VFVRSRGQHPQFAALKSWRGSLYLGTNTALKDLTMSRLLATLLLSISCVAAAAPPKPGPLGGRVTTPAGQAIHTPEANAWSQRIARICADF